MARHRLRSRVGLPGLLGGDVPIPQAHSQAQFHGAIIVRQRQHRLLILSDTRGGQGLHRADHGFQIAGSADLRRKLANVSLMASSWVRDRISAGRGRSLYRRLAGSPCGPRRSTCHSRKALADLGRDVRRRLFQSFLGIPHLSIGTLSRTPPVNATRMTICSGTDAGSSSGWMRMARIRWPWSMILRVCSSSRVPNLAKDSSSVNCAYASLRSPATAR